MRIRTFALLAFCLLLPFAGLGAKGPLGVVRPIEVKGDEGVVPGTVGRPAVITSAEELKAVFPGGSVQERLRKAVDFRTERLLVFAWSGQAGETITSSVREEEECPKAGPIREVTFTRQAGDGEQVRNHLRLFVLPKGDRTRWKVAAAKRATVD